MLFAPVVVTSEVQLPTAILPFAVVLSRKAKVPKAVLLHPVLFVKEQKPKAVLLTPDVLFDKAPKPTAVVESAVFYFQHSYQQMLLGMLIHHISQQRNLLQYYMTLQHYSINY